ncbi:hypothetical protein VTJ83DRAFT_4931 [Remersonia thermophila]|uniref:MT-A70-domain-containing protein n=1 Tax=Remersonia thermophila TaxID=72144 RepID=A0ABR4DBC1_9PEZI
MASSSSILWQNESKTVVLLDLPRSIEEAQVPPSDLNGARDAETRGPWGLRRLISSPPPEWPFPTPEPKTGGGSGPPTAPAAAQVAELMTRAAVESALDEIRRSYAGPWCLPRVTVPVSAPISEGPSPTAADAAGGNLKNSTPADSSALGTCGTAPDNQAGNPPDDASDAAFFRPPGSRLLQASILPSRDAFLAATTPGQFHLVVLDPPWPNRSARRKHRHRHRHDPRASSASQDPPLTSTGASTGTSTGTGTAAKPKAKAPTNYRTAPDLPTLRSLLSALPIASRLAPGGLVAVWLTNSPRCAELLAGTASSSSEGLFAEWGVEPVGEWVWVKATARGEPVVPVESAWRRPWERLVIARRRAPSWGDEHGGGGAGGGAGGGGAGAVKTKVIVSVPDVHSRKPNLRGLLEELLPDSYEALEVFARNLTAGWWAWGDEVLKFQRREWWAEEVSEAAAATAATEGGSCPVNVQAQLRHCLP